MSLTASSREDKLLKVRESNNILQCTELLKNVNFIEVIEVYLLNEFHNGNRNIDIKMAVDKINQIKRSVENINGKTYYDIMNFFIKKFMLQILIDFNPAMFKKDNVKPIIQMNKKNDLFENGFMHIEEILNMNK